MSGAVISKLLCRGFKCFTVKAVLGSPGDTGALGIAVWAENTAFLILTSYCDLQWLINSALPVPPPCGQQ